MTAIYVGDTFHVVQRVLSTNFGTFITLPQSLSYAQPMCEEVESILDEDGCTKAAMGRFRLLDSFLRVTLRLNSASAGTHRS